MAPDGIGRDVAAVMSLPRLSFTANYAAMAEAAGMLGLRVQLYGGAFWSQTITAALEETIEKHDPKYILTCDYDTVFVAADVVTLYEIMEKHPELGALCALQSKRADDGVLLALSDAKSTEVPRSVFARDWVAASFGHFGLTMIRSDALKKLPRPWFQEQCDSEGRWRNPDKLDADAWFWRQWRNSGFVLGATARVVVGHVEFMIGWPNMDMRTIYQPLEWYERLGKPEEAFDYARNVELCGSDDDRGRDHEQRHSGHAVGSAV